MYYIYDAEGNVVVVSYTLNNFCMKIFTTSFIAFFFFLMIGCGNKVIPLKSKYQDRPYEFTVADNRELAWNKLIDLFTAKGLTIKNIDKNDGLITTDITSFLRSYTWENKDGSLINPDAFVVCSKFRGPLTLATSFTPSLITGQWIVRINQRADKIVLSVKLANASGKISIADTVLHGQETATTTYELKIESTAVFEKSVEDALK